MVKYLCSRVKKIKSKKQVSSSLLIGSSVKQTKLQKGGSAAAAAATATDTIKITKDELLDVLFNYANIRKLIVETFKDAHEFNYNSTSNASDPFLSSKKPAEGHYNLDNLHEWYLTKNPNFLPISEANIHMPELAFITAIIVKDLVVLFKTCRFPKKHINNNGTLEKNLKNAPKQTINRFVDRYKVANKKLNNSCKSKLNTEILKLLNFINTFIEEYKYLEFLIILKQYLLFFYQGTTEDQADGSTYILTNLDILVNTQPFIFYPSVEQINFTKVIYTMQAPFINFRLPNVRKLIHNAFSNILFDLEHDILFHGLLTHGLIPTPILYHHIPLTKIDGILSLIYKYSGLCTIIDNDFRTEHPQEVTQINTIMQKIHLQIFKNTNKIINDLKPLINYTKLDIPTDRYDLQNANANSNYSKHQNCVKYLCTVFIFDILHEYDAHTIYNGLYCINNIIEILRKYYIYHLEYHVTDIDLFYKFKPTKKVTQYLFNYITKIHLDTELPDTYIHFRSHNTTIGKIILNYIFEQDYMQKMFSKITPYENFFTI
uniref:Uncharacterized protein n=1 Tax=viral metagenome TaxID=1070528 RepID=A0A6C0HMJ4_9ZZZZ